MMGVFACHKGEIMKKEAINIRLLTALLTHYPAISSYSLHRVAPSAARRFREMKQEGSLDYDYDYSTHKYILDVSKRHILTMLQWEKGEIQ